MVDTKALEALSQAASKLNSRSDELTQAINQLNEQLAKMKLGVEVWHTSPIHETDLTHDDRPGYSPSRTEFYLGYAKIDDVWQLAVEERRIRLEFNEHTESDEEVSVNRIKPLLRVNRDVRTRAIDYLDDLVVEMQDRVNKMLESIDKAKKLARPHKSN